VTRAKSTNTVKASIADGTTINAARIVSVSAQNDSTQSADSNSISFGLAAAGATIAEATSTATTDVIIGDATINAGGVNVLASGLDDNFAKGTPGSVGALSIAAATLDTKAIAHTRATV